MRQLNKKGKQMDANYKKNTEEKPVINFKLPEFKPDLMTELNSRDWRQEGEYIYFDGLANTAVKLPLGVKVIGEKGKYELKKIF